jgi:acyl dehydratase
MSGSHLIGEIPGIDLGGIIDGGQSIALHRELPPAATVSLCSEVTAIWDKGTSAVIEVSTTASDEAGALFTSGMTMVARGAGGFGGDRGPSAKSSNVPPVREPDDVVSYETRIEQGALYRLTGDLHPVHIDPEAAKMAGFEAPVLHGLCTYGFVGRAIVGSVCKGNPARLRLFEGRFASPVHPGDEIITRIWHENTGAVVQADNQHGDPVLANAKAEVGPP